MKPHIYLKNGVWHCQDGIAIAPWLRVHGFGETVVSAYHSWYMLRSIVPDFLRTNYDMPILRH